jgi:hypothetical protein
MSSHPVAEFDAHLPAATFDQKDGKFSRPVARISKFANKLFGSKQVMVKNEFQAANIIKSTSYSGCPKVPLPEQKVLNQGPAAIHVSSTNTENSQKSGLEAKDADGVESADSKYPGTKLFGSKQVMVKNEFQAANKIKSTSHSGCPKVPLPEQRVLNQGPAAIHVSSTNTENSQKSGLEAKNADGVESADSKFPDEESIFVPYDGCLSDAYYAQIGRHTLNNEGRNALHGMETVTYSSESGDAIACRSEVSTSLSDAIESVKRLSVRSLRKRDRAFYHAVTKTGLYLKENGPLVKTQELHGVYHTAKTQYLHGGKYEPECKRIMSSTILDTLSKYLPVMQVFIGGTGFIMEQKEGNIQHFIDTVSDIPDTRELINEHMKGAVPDLSSYLDILDTQLDKSVLLALLVKITSVTQISTAYGKSKQTLQRARDEVPHKLSVYQDIRKTSQIVRSDMTNGQQQALTKRIIGKKKSEALRYRVTGAGRQLYGEKCPELKLMLESLFGENAKSHPRLTTDLLYKSPKLALTMPKAREMILSVLPDSISNISLSCCYTYTENYKSNTAQAMRHHAGRDVNANISLHNMPRTGLIEEKINAHYQRSQINYYLDMAAKNEAETLVDAKDAKGIVCADIDPVQNMGKSWRKRERLDHQWDQSRVNAITPMTHLFVKTLTDDTVIECGNIKFTQHNRSGQAVTLVNLSLYEGETVFQCFNEIFHLMSIPALDQFFRGPETAALKKNGCLWLITVLPKLQPVIQ